MFTLLKTPGAYSLPAAQPTCFEAMLYMKQAQSSYPALQPYPAVIPVTTTTTTTINAVIDPEDESNQTTTPTTTTTTTTTLPLKYTDNKYWVNGLDSTNRPLTTTLPVLHHNHAIVPTQGIIPYLKTNLYDIDAYMTPSEVAAIDGLRMLATKLQTIVQYLLSQLNSYPIAAEVFFPIRWRVKAFYKDLCANNANGVGVYNEDEATIEISSILATLAARLGDATWFGPQNKMCSLDFTVAASVAFCISTEDKFLRELLYRYYPTLVAHCHNVLTHTLGGEDKLETLIDRHTAPLRKQSLVALLGEKYANPVEQTPRKRAIRRRSNRTSIADEEEPDDDGNEDKITSFDASLDGNNGDEAQQLAQQHGQKSTTQDLLLQPDDALPYLTRHSIGPQNQTIGDSSPSQRIKQYATQAWLGTTKWLNELTPPSTSWSHQFFIIGALALTSYFIIAQATMESQEEYEKALKDTKTEERGDKSKKNNDPLDFHRPTTPLSSRYSESSSDKNNL